MLPLREYSSFVSRTPHSDWAAKIAPHSALVVMTSSCQSPVEVRHRADGGRSAYTQLTLRFDKKLIRERGYAMGQEFRGKGINVALGPMTNMGRVAAGGRNWEGFGGDPYLSGIATYETIRGLQKAGVQGS